MQFVSKEIKVRGYTIHYLEWMPSTGNFQTMVCVHGYPGSSLDFKRLSEKFKDDCRIICIDLLGSGVSESPEGKHFSVPMQADYLIEMIRLLNLKNIILIGHSYGGSICQTAVAKAPEYFSCLILLASIGSVPHKSHQKGRWGFLLAHYLLKMPNAYKVLRPLAMSGFNKLNLPLKMVEDEHRFKVYCKTVISLDFKEIGEYAMKIACPTLYISCEKDRFVNPAVRQDLEKRIFSFQYEVLQGASHFVQHTHAEYVSEIIGKFMCEVGGIRSDNSQGPIPCSNLCENTGGETDF